MPEPSSRPPTTFLQRLARAGRELLQIDLREHLDGGIALLRWIVLGALVGALAGLGGAALLEALDWASETRLDDPWLLGLLPIAGLLVGCAYHYGGGRSIEGNNLILDEIHEPTAWVPRRMAPFIFLGTVTSDLFGASAGREGAGIQISGSLTDSASRILRLGAADRRTMLIAAIAGGFGALFGVPLAGAVFALEVQSSGRIRYDALVPCLTASVIGDLVVQALGVHHTPTTHLHGVDLDLATSGKVLLAGIAFGIAGLLFIELTHGLKHAFSTLITWVPARPLVGGVIVVGMTLLVGSQLYNGLSLELIESALHGGHVPTFAFALKLVFTAVSLGAGFQGGEVTPLVAVGAALGATLAAPLGLPVALLAALGYVAVFAGASNTPLACTIMGVELFGSGALVYFAIACVISYVFSSHRSIYDAQRLAVRKYGTGDGEPPLRVVARARRYWLGGRSTPDDG